MYRCGQYIHTYVECGAECSALVCHCCAPDMTLHCLGTLSLHSALVIAMVYVQFFICWEFIIRM